MLEEYNIGKALDTIMGERENSTFRFCEKNGMLYIEAKALKDGKIYVYVVDKENGINYMIMEARDE